jgi:20S proteasome subunit alpha 6
MYVNNNRGGGNTGGNFRNHARGGFGNRDHGNRRGGSFNAGAYQQGASFRGRHNRSGKNEGSSGATRDSGSSSSKKEDLKRVVTDFRIVGVEIPELRWSWGVLSRSSKAEPQERPLDERPAKMEADDSVPAVESNAPSVGDADMAAKVDAGDSIAPIQLKSEAIDFVPEAMSSAVDVPSLFQIHFETSGTAAAAASHAALHADSSTSSRKGKRKRADVEEDDFTHPVDSGADGDAASLAGVVDTDGLGRGSVAPSVTETASEGGDWLMAAIGEDEGDGEASNADEAEHRETNDGQQYQHGELGS